MLRNGWIFLRYNFCGILAEKMVLCILVAADIALRWRVRKANEWLVDG